MGQNIKEVWSQENMQGHLAHSVIDVWNSKHACTSLQPFKKNHFCINIAWINHR
mgnify:CR=1 FL=1